MRWQEETRGSVGPASQSWEFSNVTERERATYSSRTSPGGGLRDVWTWVRAHGTSCLSNFSEVGRSQSSGCDKGNEGEGLQTVLLQREKRQEERKKFPKERTHSIKVSCRELERTGRDELVSCHQGAICTSPSKKLSKEVGGEM